jgi:catechol 2,3-dioxygenase
VWAAGSPVASEQDARLLSWQLVLPDAREIDHVVDRLRALGYVETQDAGGERAFTDASGITVALVAEPHAVA